MLIGSIQELEQAPGQYQVCECPLLSRNESVVTLYELLFNQSVNRKVEATNKRVSRNGLRFRCQAYLVSRRIGVRYSTRAMASRYNH
jgi:hypothetical protein